MMSSTTRRGLKALAAIVVILTLVALAINTLTPSPSGPVGSSYATAPTGLSAYATLLTRFGHPVNRLRVAPARARLDTRATVFLLDPSVLLASDVSALRRFVTGGGDLVAGGPNPGAWLARLLPDPPVWNPQGQTANTPLLGGAVSGGVGEVRSAGQGSWSSPEASLPTLGAPGAALLTVARLGAGQVSLLADTSPLKNGLLASSDNAAFGLRLAGPSGRPVTFVESVHGYGEGNGLAALPARWKWALLGLLGAALVAVAARFRRLGQPDGQAAARLPPRRAHIDALALALEATKRPAAAAAPVQDRARDEVRRRAGLASDSQPAALLEAAARLGLDEQEAHAVSTGRLQDEDVMPVGRALVKLWSAHGD